MKKRSEEHFPRDYLLRIIMVNGNIFYMLYLFLLQEILEHRSKSLFCSINDRSNWWERSAQMNPLVGTSEEDKAIIHKGECMWTFSSFENIRFFFAVNRRRRLTEETKSLFKIPPDITESTLIHDLFLKTITPKYRHWLMLIDDEWPTDEFFIFSTSIFRSRLLTENSMWIEETNLRTMNIGHPEVKFLFSLLIHFFVIEAKKFVQ